MQTDQTLTDTMKTIVLSIVNIQFLLNFITQYQIFMKMFCDQKTDPK